MCSRIPPPHHLRQVAKSYLEDKISQDKLAYTNHHTIAPLLQADGNTQDAVKHLKLAVLANPQSVEARNDLALAIFNLGRHYWKRALDELLICLSMDPHNALVHKNLAAVYAARGMYDKALHHAKTAVKLSPYDVMAHRNLARIYDILGDSRRALEHNTIAVRNGPGARHNSSNSADAQAYRRVAILAVGRGETKTRFAHEHYDAYRALMHKTVTLPNSRTTIELLLRARQDISF